jgi:hypothetical protein
MGEYGSVGGQASSIGPGTGGNVDLGANVMDVIRDAAAQLAAQPPEILLVAFVAIIIGGLLVFRRA